MRIVGRSRPLLLLLVVLALLGAALPAAASSAGALQDPAEEVPGSFLVEFLPGQREAVLERLRPLGLRGAERLYGTSTYRVDVPPAAAGAARQALARSGGVALVEPDVVLRAEGVTPNDPEWSRQWESVRVRAPQVWSTTTGSSDVVVAVLDTGVSAHPDLSGALLRGRSFVTTEPTTEDLNGHGTAVAGVVAARGGNGRAIAGMCWSCKILPVKVLGLDGNGSGAGIAQGIRWAADQGADIINLSLSGSRTSSTLESAVAYAIDAGALVVAAAGNEGTTEKSYPAASAGVLGVAGSDSEDARSGFSNHGSWVDVAAPGCVRTLGLLGTVSSACGTSFATPMAAGAAALLRAAHPAASAEMLSSALTSTSVPRSYVAHGRIDAEAALHSLRAPEPKPAAEGAEPTEEAPAVVEEQLEAQEPAEDERPSLERLAGDDRFETAVELSRSRFEGGADRVYVATGENFPDSLAAAPVAAADGAPVLLTGARQLPASTAAEIGRLGPREIVIVGGTSTIHAEVEAQLARLGTVRRAAGDDRYATAAAVAGSAFPGPVPVLYLASGENFPDALSGGAVAARDGAPLLLTGRTGLPPATVKALRELRPARVAVLGGRSTVGDAVLVQLSELLPATTVRRQAGDDRFTTSAAVSSAAYPTGATTVFLATAGTFPDALAAGPIAGLEGAPLLLTASASLPGSIAEELARLQPDRIVVAGGASAVSEQTLAAAARAAGIAP